MWLLLPLLLSIRLATSSFSGEWKDAPPPEIHIAYKVLEVFPRGRRVLISCHAPRGHPPLNYSLWGSGGIEVARKLVMTRAPASFSVNVTLKSRPDLLTYSCQLAGPGHVHATSTELQMYWELWTKPVSQLRANFTLQDGGAGAQVLVSCQVSTGSPPITYSLVGKDGRVHLQQTPSHRQPARFFLPMTQTPNWFQCRAENGVSADSSPFMLVPPGLLPQVPTAVLAGSLISIAAVTSGMLGWAWRTRMIPEHSHEWPHRPKGKARRDRGTGGPAHSQDAGAAPLPLLFTLLLSARGL